MKIKAFTLAETLITLVIIGVIAVLMYSNYINVIPEENSSLYKKAFYTIQDVIRSLANDTVKFPSSTLLFMAEPMTEDNKTYQQYFCEQVATSLNTLGKINCGTSGNDASDGAFSENIDDYEFKLTNGMTFTGFNQEFEDEDSNDMTSDSITVLVDVNGLDKNPNALCKTSAANCDRYRIRIHADGKVSTDESWTIENQILEDPHYGIN